MKEIESRFGLTWEKRRRDLQDQSPSSYDMALVNLLVSYKWAEQDIANTVIAFRRKHAKKRQRGQEGPLRVDYITRTIMKEEEGLREIRRR